MIPLAVARATRFLGVSPQGQSLPLIAALDLDGDEVVGLLKLAARRSGLRPRELAVELGATLVMGDLGLRVASPIIVELSEPFIAEVETALSFGVEDRHAIGYLFRNSLFPFVASTDVPKIAPEARAALAFGDLLLGNGDRTDLNPNLAWDAYRLFVFDFDHCLELGGRSADEEVRTLLAALPSLWESHILHRHLGEEEIAAIERRLDEPPGIPEMDPEALPESWHPEWTRFVEYLRRLEGDGARLKRRMMEVLRG